MDTNLELPAPSWKDRISNARTAVQARVTNLKPANLKPMFVSKAGEVRSTMQRGSAKLQDSLRSNTALWTGIAAAGGLGVGLLGRFAMNRTQHRGMPAVVIIEASC
ncbi:MAG: hypothetical protein JWO97_4391 [Acidobacteria bacterium]|nr:hypothetical protein [Acidobacteriota bacterium]